jgi:glycogen synthase
MICSTHKTRILMTTDAVGGVWTYALELAAATAEHGCEFVLAVLGPSPSKAQRRDAARLRNVRLVAAEYKLEWMDDPWHDVDAAGEWLLSLCRSVRPDVVHLNQYSFASLPFGAPVLLVAHSCICSWWMGVHGKAAPHRYAEYCARVSAGLAAADCIVAPTCSMLEQLMKHYGPTTGEVRIINNARRLEGLAPRCKDPVVLAAGRLWDAAKNIDALDAVASKLPWPCLMAGELVDPDGRKVAPKSLVPLGWLNETDMAAQLSRAAIFAHPARYEPFGLAPLEAALAGCALVLGDIPSLRELWEGAASFVDPEDPETLRLALEELISRPARRSRAAAAAFQRAALYSPERLGASYAGVYRTLRESATSGLVEPAPARQH